MEDNPLSGLVTAVAAGIAKHGHKGEVVLSTTHGVLQTKRFGRYEIELIRWNTKEFAYRIMRNGVKVNCRTKSEERRYPIIPAWIGTTMVAEAKAAAEKSLAGEVK